MYIFPGQHPDFKHLEIEIDRNIDIRDGAVYDLRRTSDKVDLGKYHQYLSRPRTKNTIMMNGVSAWSRGDIYRFIEILVVDKKLKRFTIETADETRFTRSSNTALRVYSLLRANRVNLTLVLGEKSYDYANDFFNTLDDLFKNAQASSDEKSRRSKEAWKKKKQIERIGKPLREFFIVRMIAFFNNDIGKVCEICQELGLKKSKLNLKKITSIQKEKHQLIRKLIKGRSKFHYAKCYQTGHYFVTTPSMAKRKDLCFSMMGIGGPNEMEKFFKQSSLRWFCCRKTDFAEGRASG